MIEKERKNDHAGVRYIYNKFVSRFLQQGLLSTDKILSEIEKQHH